jgi:hypothetical protein
VRGTTVVFDKVGGEYRTPESFSNTNFPIRISNTQFEFGWKKQMQAPNAVKAEADQNQS